MPICWRKKNPKNLQKKLNGDCRLKNVPYICETFKNTMR